MEGVPRRPSFPRAQESTTAPPPARREDSVMSDLLIWVIGIDHTQTGLKKAQKALAEAAPEEWAQYERSRAAYEAARTLVVRDSAVKEAEAELKMTAAAQWKAYQKAQDALSEAIDQSIQANKAVKEEAPDQYAEIRIMFRNEEYFDSDFDRRYKEARQALKAVVSPSKWEKYESAYDLVFDKGVEMREAEKELRDNAPMEMEVYYEAVIAADNARRYRQAPMEWAHFYAAEEALILAAPDEWSAYENAQTEDEFQTAQIALSKAAPKEWEAYETAEDALNDKTGRRRSFTQYIDI